MDLFFDIIVTSLIFCLPIIFVRYKIAEGPVDFLIAIMILVPSSTLSLIVNGLIHAHIMGHTDSFLGIAAFCLLIDLVILIRK